MRTTGEVRRAPTPTPTLTPTPTPTPTLTLTPGKPGYYPSLKEAEGIPHPVPFDLFNPLGLLPEQTEAEKARGRNVEINNGRA